MVNCTERATCFTHMRDVSLCRHKGGVKVLVLSMYFVESVNERSSTDLGGKQDNNKTLMAGQGQDKARLKPVWCLADARLMPGWCQANARLMAGGMSKSWLKDNLKECHNLIKFVFWASTINCTNLSIPDFTFWMDINIKAKIRWKIFGGCPCWSQRVFPTISADLACHIQSGGFTYSHDP